MMVLTAWLIFMKSKKIDDILVCFYDIGKIDKSFIRLTKDL